MKKPLRGIIGSLTLLVLCMLMSSQLILIKPAYANPESAVYQSHPTAHTVIVVRGFTVTNPTNAYDSLNNTYANFDYIYTAGFEVKSFTTLTNPWRITQVDFKMRYKTTASSKDDKYRIIYYVDPSATATVLVDWTRDQKSLYTYTWAGRTEPNDGAWSWTDISKIRFVVETLKSGGADTPGTFYEYETWVAVHYRGPTLYVDPTSQTVGAPFTVDINITNMDDLYAWEFNVTYDTTILTATNVAEKPFLNSTGATYFNKMINDTNGWIYAYCTLLYDVPGVTGSGDLATISFSIDATGSSTLDLHNTKLLEYEWVNKKNYTYPNPHYVKEVDGSVTATVPVPEFPLGAAMEIALVTVVIYVWWKAKRKTSPGNPRGPPQ